MRNNVSVVSHVLMSSVVSMISCSSHMARIVDIYENRFSVF